MEKVKKLLNDSAWARWGAVLLVSFTMAANYYFYDAMSPIVDLLRTKLNFSNTDYGFLVSTYSIPNVFLAMAIIGGVILDRLGIRITGTVFVLFMVVGAFLTAYGASDTFRNGGLGFGLMQSILPQYSPELKMMSLGFFLFGFGAETSIVATSKIIVKWFKGRELALAMGVNVALARVGTGMALLLSPRLVSDSSWNFPLWFAALLMFIGLFTFLIYLMTDVKFDKQHKQALALAGAEGGHAEAASSDDETFRFKDLVSLVTNPGLIFITLLCVTFYSAVFPFLKYAPDLLQNKFGIDRELAGSITSLLPFATVLFTPLFGYFTDKVGRSASVMLIGSGLLIAVHLTFTFTTITPYVPIAVLGIAFSLVPAAMWPSVAKIVDVSKIGSAYGFMFSVQNIGLWLFPMLIGLVLDRSNSGVTQELVDAGAAVWDYTNTTLMLAGLGLLGFLFSFLLLRADKKHGYGLELPNIQK
jgi:MFS family permease